MQDGATPLFIACEKGNLPVIECLITANANVNTPMKVGYLPTVMHYNKQAVMPVEIIKSVHDIIIDF